MSCEDIGTLIAFCIIVSIYAAVLETVFGKSSLEKKIDEEKRWRKRHGTG